MESEKERSGGGSEASDISTVLSVKGVHGMLGTSEGPAAAAGASRARPPAYLSG